MDKEFLKLTLASILCILFNTLNFYLLFLPSHTENTDFLPVNTQLILIVNSGTTMCVTVDIVDDIVVETNQSFTLELSSLTPTVTVSIGGDVATVTILDEDGKNYIIV